MAMMDTSYTVRMTARDSLIAVGKDAVDELILHLEDQFANDTLRGRVAYVLGRLGPKAEEATPALLAIINNERSERQLRVNSIRAIGEIGPKAGEALDALRETLKHEASQYIRQITVRAIGGLGYRAEEAIPDLLSLYFNYYSEDMRRTIDDALTQMGWSAADTLASLVKDTSLHGYFRKRFITVLARIGGEAFFVADTLASIVADTSESMEIRALAAKAIGSYGKDGRTAIPTLIWAMAEGRTWLSVNARESLIEIGDAAIDPLIEVIKDPSENRARRAGAVEVIGAIGPKAGRAVTFLVDVLLDSTHVDGGEWQRSLYDFELRHGSIVALGRIGADALPAVPVLISNLGATYTNDRSAAAVALTRMAEGCVDAKDTDAIPVLEAAFDSILSREFISISSVEWNDEHIGRFSRSLESLRLIKQFSFGRAIIVFLEENAWARRVLLVIALYIIVIGLCYLLLFFKPLWLLYINDFLAKWLHDKTGLFKPMGNAIGYIAVIRFFHYQKRVLDAWVKQKLPTARENFDKIPSVAARRLHVDMPFVLNDGTLGDSRDPALRALFEVKRVRVLIWGTGGSGKSSIAFQLGRLAMSPNRNERLNQGNPMIPVVIGGEFHRADDSLGAVVKTVQGFLSDLLGSDLPVNANLVQRLMLTRRLLIIVDGMSELGDDSRALVSPASAEFPVHALIVTSRMKEDLAGVAVNQVKPLLLRHNSLFSFIDRYLVTTGCREDFGDDEFADAVGKLSKMVAGREIPVLIVKLFADEMIASESGSRRMSETIPELMLRYIGLLNEAVSPDRIENRLIHSGLMALSWRCISVNYRPESIPVEDAEEVLMTVAPSLMLFYLIDRLQVLQVTGAQESSVRFSLDPIAEYYAAIHALGYLGSDDTKWQQLIQDISGKDGYPEVTSGFTSALYDCVVAEVHLGHLEDKYVAKVVPLTTVDNKELEKFQLRRRIKRLRDNLQADEVQDRISAVGNARELGRDAYLLTDDLIQCFRYPGSKSLFENCVITLSESIGTLAVPALIRACDDEDPNVRSGSIRALARIQVARDEIFPTVFARLDDEDHRVRRSAIEGVSDLAKLHCAECERTELSEKLSVLISDNNVDVKISAAKALVVLGRTPASASIRLSECTQSENKELVAEAVRALATLPDDCWDTTREALRGAIGRKEPKVVLAALGVISKLTAVRVYELYPELLSALQNTPAENLRFQYKKDYSRPSFLPSWAEYSFMVSATYTASEGISQTLCYALSVAGDSGVSDLLTLLDRTTDEEVRLRILLVLANMSSLGAAALPTVIRIAREGSQHERVASICVVGEMEVANRDVEDCLRECSRDADRELSEQARIALGKLGYDT